MSEMEEHPTPLELQVPLGETVPEREAFSEELLSVGSGDELRLLYEKFIDRIGANGIIHEVESVNPTCHGVGHPLGRVIFSKLGKIGPSLRTCQDACNSGCMHGVFMESFAPDRRQVHEAASDTGKHPYFIQRVKDQIPTLCSREILNDLYKPGDCAHGVGHAIMHITDYDIPRAMDHCRLFGSYPMVYYCATGGYMEYVTENDPKNRIEKSLFYPCDTGEYPAACFRYKMVHVIQRPDYLSGKLKDEDIAARCIAMENKYRWGCFHGFGNAKSREIRSGGVGIPTVCRFGTDADQTVCIDGAVERLAKYHPDKAQAACRKLEGWRRDLCLSGANRGMYDLDKSFKYYLR